MNNNLDEILEECELNKETKEKFENVYREHVNRGIEKPKGDSELSN